MSEQQQTWVCRVCHSDYHTAIDLLDHYHQSRHYTSEGHSASAKPIDGHVTVVFDGVVEGTTCVHIPMQSGDYAEYHRLPDVLEFRGKMLGKSGWNSDSKRCYYQSNVPVAKVVK